MKEAPNLDPNLVMEEIPDKLKETWNKPILVKDDNIKE